MGVATTPNTYNFTLRVTSNGVDFDQAATVKITALTLKDQTSLPDAFVGTAPAPYQLTALGAAGPVTFTPTSLPAGLSLTAGGLLSGTPSSPGSPNINFTISDGTDTVSKSVFRQVFAVNITTPGLLPNATQNAVYNAAVAASGGTGPYTFTASGLPNGLSISSGGVISGTVTQGAGKTNVQVQAKDSLNVT